MSWQALPCVFLVGCVSIFAPVADTATPDVCWANDTGKEVVVLDNTDELFGEDTKRSVHIGYATESFVGTIEQYSEHMREEQRGRAAYCETRKDSCDGAVVMQVGPSLVFSADYVKTLRPGEEVCGSLRPWPKEPKYMMGPYFLIRTILPTHERLDATIGKGWYVMGLYENSRQLGSIAVSRETLQSESDLMEWHQEDGWRLDYGDIDAR